MVKFETMTSYNSQSDQLQYNYLGSRLIVVNYKVNMKKVCVFRKDAQQTPKSREPLSGNSYKTYGGSKNEINFPNLKKNSRLIGIP